MEGTGFLLWSLIGCMMGFVFAVIGFYFYMLFQWITGRCNAYWRIWYFVTTFPVSRYRFDYNNGLIERRTKK